MSELSLSEQLKNQLQTTTFTYESADQGRDVIASLTARQKEQMAVVYQTAFAGPPWYERYQCQQCGEFAAASGICAKCSSSQLIEAYPTEQLVNNYFPQMLGEFAPGMLLTAENGIGEMIGWTTGGMTSLEDLIAKKYKGNQQILESIVVGASIQPNSVLFYDNETCVNPTLQQKGLGKILSQQRIEVAQQLGADLICGRTINLPWLNVKRQQLQTAGYSFTAFRPDGDTYEMDGVPRQFYVARRIIN